MSSSSTTTTQTTQYPAYPAYGYGYPGRLPIGVAILAVLVGVVGFLVFLDGLLFLFLGISFLNFTAPGGTVLGFGRLGGSFIIMIVGLIMMGVASGLWNQRLWALVVAIIATFIIFVLFLLAGALLGIIISLVVLIYLLAVHRHFL
jgi:hypothetical protein